MGTQQIFWGTDPSGYHTKQNPHMCFPDQRDGIKIDRHQITPTQQHLINFVPIKKFLCHMQMKRV